MHGLHATLKAIEKAHQFGSKHDYTSNPYMTHIIALDVSCFKLFNTWVKKERDNAIENKYIYNWTKSHWLDG